MLGTWNDSLLGKMGREEQLASAASRPRCYYLDVYPRVVGLVAVALLLFGAGGIPIPGSSLVPWLRKCSFFVLYSNKSEIVIFLFSIGDGSVQEKTDCRSTQMIQGASSRVIKSLIGPKTLNGVHERETHHRCSGTFALSDSRCESSSQFTVSGPLIPGN